MGTIWEELGGVALEWYELAKGSVSLGTGLWDFKIPGQAQCQSVLLPVSLVAELCSHACLCATMLPRTHEDGGLTL